MTLRVAYIHPLPTLEKNLKVLIKVLMIYPMLVVKKNLKVLIKQAMVCKVEYWVGETASESTNQTDGGITDNPKGWHEIHPTWKVVNE